MDAALIGSTFVLGLAGAPHCTAMCAGPCTAAIGRGGAGAQWAFHAARLAGYAAAGAAVAAGVGALAALGQVASVARPLWTVLHAALLALGLWLLWQGRQPAWLAGIGRVPAAATGGTVVLQGAGGAPVRALAAGGLWVMWPCGLLQSALIVAAMTHTALAGATAMAAFAIASSLGLVAAPWLWRRLGRLGGAAAERWAVRAAGALIVAASGWVLGHGLWQQVSGYCAVP